MKRHILPLIILISFLISCKNQKLDYNFKKIEFVVYYWMYDKNPYGNHVLIGEHFAVIDSLGECNVIDYNKGVLQFKSIQTPDTLLKRLSDNLSLLKSDIDLRPSPNKPLLYVGPSLRITFYSENGVKNVDFIDTKDHSEDIYLEFYHYIENLNQNAASIDTTLICDLRRKQLENIYDKLYKSIFWEDTTVLINRIRMIK